MSSIITVTLNPAIDKSSTIPQLLPEKKLKCTIPFFEPGGGGINVARALKKLGTDATAIYLAGGYTGNFFTQLLNNESISCAAIEIAHHTRENLIVLDSSANLQYRFGMPGPVVAEHEWKNLLETLDAINEVDFIVASGSIPQGVPTDIFARIAALAKKKNARCIVDTSGAALQNAAEEGLFLIKPNINELSALTGKDELPAGLVADAAREVIAKGNCEYVMVSMGAAGAMLVSGDEAKQITAPDVIRKSTVGAGDSMVAGIVYSLSKGHTIMQAAQYGVACGTAATMNPGTELCRFEDAEKLYAAISQQQ
jgi:6-phosphofructokinase 2